MARRKQRAMTKDRWAVQLPETITEEKDEDDEDAMTLAEQYEEWKGKYHTVDAEDDEESGSEAK